MANGSDPSKRWVSNGELKDELDEVKRDISDRPNRREVRLLVALAIVLSPSVPPINDVAQAAWFW